MMNLFLRRICNFVVLGFWRGLKKKLSTGSIKFQKYPERNLGRILGVPIVDYQLIKKKFELDETFLLTFR